MITVDRQVAEQLIRYCEKERPIEACGVLWGTVHAEGHVAVAQFEGLTNAALRQESNFLFKPEEWIRILYNQKSRREQLVGIFHSHPSSPAQPSLSDLSSGWQFPTYWIVSVADPEKPVLNGFLIDSDRMALQQQLLFQ